MQPVKNGPLLGAPLAHKDLFCTQGIRTSCGSLMLDNFKAPYDATVVSRLASAGTVTLGKTNMDEFAMGSANESSHYGAVKTRGTRNASLAVLRAARQLLLLRVCYPPRPAPTPVARFASLQR